VDVINPDKLCVNLFKGFDFTGFKVSIFPIGNWRRRYNSAALPRSLWFASGLSEYGVRFEIWRPLAVKSAWRHFRL